MLAGFTAFLDLYATQPLLPLFMRTFHASHVTVSLTITAPTIAVALAAPFAGRLADRMGLRRVILGSAFGLALATALAATSNGLGQIIGWRFIQGLITPGVFAGAMAYIHHEWPPSRIGRATAAYIGGTVTGGFTGRALAGITAAGGDWRTAFLALGALNIVVAIALWRWLPLERHADTPEARETGAFVAHLRYPQLLATYVVGFCVLCAQVAMFTYVPFHLEAPPYSLSTAALGWLFAVYLVGAIVTPLSGRWIDHFGQRIGISLAVVLGVVGSLLTLVSSLTIVIVGLSLFATAVFIAQSSASSHVGASTERDRGLAIGLYSTFYYLGGSVGGVVPALAWNRAGWLGCVALIIGVQMTTLAIAVTTWSRRRGPHVDPEPA
jgi:predicted MFS family arabinose efflux permease